LDKPDTFSTSSKGGKHNFHIGRHNSSNLGLVIVVMKSVASASESTSIVVCPAAERILLALSH